MAKNLLIVESPAKAKTIEKYLGKDFTVKASYGHVRDLPKGDNAIDFSHGFEPHYEVIEDKKKVISELKSLISKSEKVWLATDEDREGEAISWHLAQVLGLDLKQTPRIVFNEITQSAITRAIASPRLVNEQLVDAQQARRVLDRIVGFKLSPILWRKIKGGLSAGRVQSVAVRLLVDREREIQQFKSKAYFKVSADFLTEGNAKVRAELTRRPENAEDARAFLQSCIGADYTVRSLETKPARKSPAPPFITSTLQQEASRKLGFSVSRTMRVAQGLYESGSITYMRTDSVNLSDYAISQAQDVVNSLFGARYHKLRQFKNKNSSAQEAHEAIRPTDFSVQQVSADRDAQRLYELIWKRALASQMADAELERTVADIEVSGNKAIFRATGEVMLFDGFLKLYIESRDDNEEEEEDEGVLPPMKVGEMLKLREMVALERYTRPEPRYTEASLVKKLEELGIGRPSTYAPTISTIQDRQYVVRESREGETRNCIRLTLRGQNISESIKTEASGAEKNKLFPTDLGMVVTDFLVKFFPSILDFSFTRQVEEEFDEIAEGKRNWRDMIAGFYDQFSPQVDQTIAHADRESGERALGDDPKSGKPVIARLGRFGPLVQLGRSDGDEKPAYAKLRKDQRLESISLEEALDLFKLPRQLGEHEGQPVKVSVGRFGPYVQLGSVFASLDKEDDPYDIELARAIELLDKKRQTDAERIIKQISPDVAILNGRWGAYIKYRKENVKIPKEIAEPANLTLEDIERIVELQQAKPKKAPPRRGAKKS